MIGAFAELSVEAASNALFRLDNWRTSGIII